MNKYMTWAELWIYYQVNTMLLSDWEFLEALNK